jgi:hypothetical protein
VSTRLALRLVGRRAAKVRPSAPASSRSKCVTVAFWRKSDKTLCVTELEAAEDADRVMDATRWRPGQRLS